MKKIQQGEFTYLKNKKKREVIKTIIFFAIPLALFLMGIFSTGTRANLLTIVAVLGMLPASKSAVGMIMYLRAKGCSEELRQELKDITADLTHSYGLVFTTYDKTYEVPSVVVSGDAVYGLIGKEYPTLEKLEKHITDMLKRNGFKCSVKIFTKKDAYYNKLKTLEKPVTESPEPESQEPAVPESKLQKEQEIMHILHLISL